MRANIPRAYQSLSPAEKRHIQKYIADIATQAAETTINEEEAEVQKIWIKMACIVLHENFGFGESRCLQFIGSWRMMYRRNARLKTKKEQTEYLSNRLSFFEEYPEDFVDSLEKIGD